MWHDDISLASSVFIMVAIIILTALYLNFSPTSIQLRGLKKFNHFTEFDKVKQNDAKFQILKQETMRIDNKLMAVDQSKFDILALAVNEDDSLCRPECVPLIYNISISSIHGNVFLNIPNSSINVLHSLHIEKTKNELNMNFINFSGYLEDANIALKNMVFEPLCPFDNDNIIQLKVLVGAENGLEASGQLISMSIGQYKEIKGTGQTEIIDMPIYQHLSRNKNTLVIGKIIDSLNQSPIKNATISSRMTGY